MRELMCDMARFPAISVPSNGYHVPCPNSISTSMCDRVESKSNFNSSERRPLEEDKFSEMSYLR